MVRTIHNEQFWQWEVQGDSVTEVPAVSLESSPPDEVEWQVDEDDEDEAEVEGEENEVEHNEVKEDILRKAQQVIHGDWFWNITIIIIITYSETGHTYEPLQHCDQLCSRTSATAVEQWRDQTGAGAAAAFPQPGRVAAPAQGRDQRPSVTITLINGHNIHFCLDT